MNEKLFLIGRNIYNKLSFPGKSTKINGQCLKNLSESGFLPTSVGGLHAPTN